MNFDGSSSVDGYDRVGESSNNYRNDTSGENFACPVFGTTADFDPLRLSSIGTDHQGLQLGNDGQGFDDSFWEDLFAADTNQTPRDFFPSGEFTPNSAVGDYYLGDQQQQELQLPQSGQQQQQVGEPMMSSVVQPGSTSWGTSQISETGLAAASEDTTRRGGKSRAAASNAAALTGSVAGKKRKEPQEGKDDDDADFNHSSSSVRAAAYEAKRKADAEYEQEVPMDQSATRKGNKSSSKEERSRERNRVHARKSRLRKKFFLDSLKTNLETLEKENKELKDFIKQTTGKSYEDISNTHVPTGSAADRTILEGPQNKATKKLESVDYQLVQALTISQQNFVVSDPKLPDNPIVFASRGFYQLTGYSPQEVIGRNCRFLQGPDTDPDTVSLIRTGIENGEDTAVCLINYKKDGSPFWNQFFVAPLRGSDGGVVNYIGVQCEVSEDVAKASINAAKQQGRFRKSQRTSS